MRSNPPGLSFYQKRPSRGIAKPAGMPGRSSIETPRICLAGHQRQHERLGFLFHILFQKTEIALRFWKRYDKISTQYVVSGTLCVDLGRTEYGSCDLSTGCKGGDGFLKAALCDHCEEHGKPSMLQKRPPTKNGGLSLERISPYSSARAGWSVPADIFGNLSLIPERGRRSTAFPYAPAGSPAAWRGTGRPWRSNVKPRRKPHLK